jgi:hypothetical protein
MSYAKAELIEDVYIRPLRATKWWRLRKALYGLKQAGMEWNREIDEYLKSIGLTACRYDHCLYYKRTTGGLLLLCLYVDDILMACTDATELEAL